MTAANASTNPFDLAVSSVLSDSATSRQAAETIHALLSLDERLGLLDSDHYAGPTFNELRKERYNVRPYIAGEVARVGLPGIRFSDGPRGCSLGESTAFPAPITRAAAWDPELEEQIGRAIAREIRAQGGNTFGGVCVNVARHPAWGRAQEAYGEDPLVLGTMGAALSRGASTELMPIVKHFALNSMEDMRFQVDVECDEATLHECYFPHFKQVLDEGHAASVMSCYNTVNGTQGGDHPQLNGVIRELWQREDVFVMSDFLWGLRDGPASVKAGMDIEMMIRSVRWRSLPAALKRGTITEDDIARLGVRLIAAQIDYRARLIRDGHGEAPPINVVGCTSHLDLSRQAAQAGMVLLKNDNALLPLKRVRRLAVVGEIARARQTGDAGSSAVFTPEIITPLEGLEAYGRQHGVEVVWCDAAVLGLSKALDVASSCDAIIAVVGLTRVEEGESMFCTDPAINSVCFPGIWGSFLVTRLMQLVAPILNNVGGDRDNLQLRPVDLALANALAASKPLAGKTSLVVSAGSTICLPPAVTESLAAILFTGYGGCRFGDALANVLFAVDGAEPSGRLPYVIPRDEINDLPLWQRWAKRVVYDRWWGYRFINRDHKRPAYPFGFGLGYGTWEFVPSSLKVDKEASRDRFWTATVGVRNTGTTATTAIVQIYGGKSPEALGPDDYANVLLGWTRVGLPVSSDSFEVTVHCRWNPIARWQGAASPSTAWLVEPAQYVVRASQFEGDEHAESVAVDVKEPITWAAA